MLSSGFAFFVLLSLFGISTAATLSTFNGLARPAPRSSGLLATAASKASQPSAVEVQWAAAAARVLTPQALATFDPAIRHLEHSARVAVVDAFEHARCPPKAPVLASRLAGAAAAAASHSVPDAGCSSALDLSPSPALDRLLTKIHEVAESRDSLDHGASNRTIQVLVLGGSVSRGSTHRLRRGERWPVAQAVQDVEMAWPTRFQHVLQAAVGSRARVELVNRASCATTSHQLRDSLQDRVLPGMLARTDLIVLETRINDWGSAGFSQAPGIGFMEETTAAVKTEAGPGDLEGLIRALHLQAAFEGVPTPAIVALELRSGQEAAPSFDMCKKRNRLASHYGMAVLNFNHLTRSGAGLKAVPVEDDTEDEEDDSFLHRMAPLVSKELKAEWDEGTDWAPTAAMLALGVERGSSLLETPHVSDFSVAIPPPVHPPHECAAAFRTLGLISERDYLLLPSAPKKSPMEVDQCEAMDAMHPCGLGHDYVAAFLAGALSRAQFTAPGTPVPALPAPLFLTVKEASQLIPTSLLVLQRPSWTGVGARVVRLGPGWRHGEDVAGKPGLLCDPCPLSPESAAVFDIVSGPGGSLLLGVLKSYVQKMAWMNITVSDTNGKVISHLRRWTRWGSKASQYDHIQVHVPPTTRLVVSVSRAPDVDPATAGGWTLESTQQSPGTKLKLLLLAAY